MELWEGQRKSSQEEGNATHILAKVLIKAFQPKIPTRKGKFELHCSLKKPKVVFPSICPNIGTNISNSLLSKKKHFCSPSLCKYLGYK